VRKLNTDTYRPDGSTALLDAIGMTSDTIEREIKQSINPLNSTVVVVILTDGHENSSKSFKLEDIRKQISRLEETGRWTFTFMGATLDAVEIAESMAIRKENSMMFEKSNMRNGVFSKLSSSMESYMHKKRKGDNLDNFF
jgi:Mg-chelatase subunit ChlD